MSNQEIIELMRTRGYTYYAETRNGKGETTGLTFIHPESDAGFRYIPSYSVTVTPKGEFRAMYSVPHSINCLETPFCSPVSNEDHFNNILCSFETQCSILARYC